MVAEGLAEGLRRRRAPKAPRRKNGLSSQGTATIWTGTATIWTGTATIWTEPLPFGLYGAFGGRLRRSEPGPARRAPSAQ